MWILVDIGCIECGEESAIVGVYSDKTDADAWADRLNDKLSFTGGQHVYEVFPMPEADLTAEPYRDY